MRPASDRASASASILTTVSESLLLENQNRTPSADACGCFEGNFPEAVQMSILISDTRCRDSDSESFFRVASKEATREEMQLAEALRKKGTNSLVLI